MNCESCLDHLIDHAHGELGHPERVEMSTHLGSCGECAAAYCRLEADMAGIVLAESEAPSVSVRDALRAKVQAEFSPTWWRRAARLWLQPIPAYGALALSAIPFLVWLAVSPPLGERSVVGSDAAQGPARLEAYDASEVPPTVRGVL